jgi:hypothetical protein
MGLGLKIIPTLIFFFSTWNQFKFVVVSCETTPFPTHAQESGSQFLLHYTKLTFKWPYLVCPPPIFSIFPIASPSCFDFCYVTSKSISDLASTIEIGIVVSSVLAVM